FFFSTHEANFAYESNFPQDSFKYAVWKQEDDYHICKLFISFFMYGMATHAIQGEIHTERQFYTRTLTPDMIKHINQNHAL
ncbi:hypothetical protein ACJX0J_040536, partial [Zea mays]